MNIRIQDRWGNALGDSGYGRQGQEYSLDNLFLRNVYFKKANLEGESLYNTCCENGCFYACDLYWAELSYADFSNADLRDADLRGISATGTVFWRADLRGTNFALDNLGKGVDFRDCDFTEMIWNEFTDFEGASYNENTVFPADFCPERKGMVKKFNDEASSHPAENRIFRYGNYAQSSFAESQIGQTIWSFANLSDCNFSLCDAYAANFTAADLRKAVFMGASLIRANFYKTDLRGGDFSAGKYSEAADLSDADLREIIWDDSTNFTGALYNRNTFFPDCFDSQKSAMLEVE